MFFLPPFSFVPGRPLTYYHKHLGDIVPKKEMNPGALRAVFLDPERPAWRGGENGKITTHLQKKRGIQDPSEPGNFRSYARPPG
jgi:hypothetical protein